MAVHIRQNIVDVAFDSVRRKIASLLGRNNRGFLQLVRAAALLGWVPVDQLTTLLGGFTAAQQSYVSHIRTFRDQATGFSSNDDSYCVFCMLHHGCDWFLAVAEEGPQLAQRLFYHTRTGSAWTWCASAGHNTTGEAFRRGRTDGRRGKHTKCPRVHDQP